MKLCPVILAGGSGTRLWPLSRQHYPKQFLRLFGEHSLLQATLLRIRGLHERLDVLPTLLVCNEVHRFVVQEQAAAIDEAVQSIILEPVGRNTAPALTLAALAQEKDTVLLMLPADHSIADVEKFEQTLAAGMAYAEAGHIVTFGIRPTAANTAYGYIKKGQRKAPSAGGVDVFLIERFAEKPDQQTAERYCATRDYLWNSGMFMLRTSLWRESVRQLAPDISAACQAAWTGGRAEGVFYHLDNDEFEKCPADSVDYAVLERLQELQAISAYVIPADVAWSDVGSWDAVWSQGQGDPARCDENKNVMAGDVVLHGCSNTLVQAESRLVAALGCDNLAVIETADAVMVMDRRGSQQMTHLIGILQQQNREELRSSAFTHRPWGGYESIQSAPGYQVKRLLVKPGKKISLQLHHQRTEHWVIVKGHATVTCGDEVHELGVNESIYIEVGTKHRLANNAKQDLEVIEVQIGGYLGEDDIVRFDDDFGRA